MVDENVKVQETQETQETAPKTPRKFNHNKVGFQPVLPDLDDPVTNMNHTLVEYVSADGVYRLRFDPVSGVYNLVCNKRWYVGMSVGALDSVLQANKYLDMFDLAGCVDETPSETAERVAREEVEFPDPDGDEDGRDRGVG